MTRVSHSNTSRDTFEIRQMTLASRAVCHVTPKGTSHKTHVTLRCIVSHYNRNHVAKNREQEPNRDPRKFPANRLFHFQSRIRPLKADFCILCPLGSGMKNLHRYPFHNWLELAEIDSNWISLEWAFWKKKKPKIHFFIKKNSKIYCSGAIRSRFLDFCWFGEFPASLGPDDSVSTVNDLEDSLPFVTRPPIVFASVSITQTDDQSDKWIMEWTNKLH